MGSEYKVKKMEGNTVLVTVAFERPTPVVWNQTIGEVEKIFESRRNREHRFPNIRRFEMVRVSLNYAQSLEATLDNMFNDGAEMTNLNMVLRFENSEDVKCFCDNIFDVVIKDLHELNKTAKKRGS